MPQPLSTIFVLDFSTLLPGPLATLLLAEAGAEVIKIERPGGEDMHRFRAALSARRPLPGPSSTAARRIRTIDLKTPKPPLTRGRCSSAPTSLSSSSGPA